MARKEYEALHLLPAVVAENVCLKPYEGQEFSNPSPREVARVEALRQKLTDEQIRAFYEYADAKCRIAYESKAKWFMDCLKGERGRDQLYVWMTHWMVAYLMGVRLPTGDVLALC